MGISGGIEENQAAQEGKGLTWRSTSQMPCSSLDDVYGSQALSAADFAERCTADRIVTMPCIEQRR